MIPSNISALFLHCGTIIKLSPELIGKYPNLVEFIKRMENLPRIADFLKSNRCPGPMNNKMAAFGASKL